MFEQQSTVPVGQLAGSLIKQCAWNVFHGQGQMCFVNAKGIGDYKEDSWNEACSQKTYSFWKPFSLEFFKSSKERQYRKVSHPAWLVQDFVGYCIILAAGPIALYAMSNVLPIYYLGVIVTLHFVIPPVLIYFYVAKKDAFARLRFRSVLFIRLVLLLAFIGFGFFVESPEASVSAILAVFMTKSPTPNLFFCSLVHRVEFKHHIVIQLLAFLESLLWIPLFCQTCATEPNVLQTFNKIGYGIDWFFSYIFLNTEPDPIEYPCWMISVMIMATLGFCIPSLLIFFSEVSARAMFVRSRISHKAHFALYSYTSEAFKVGLSAFVAALMATWFLLTHAARLLY